MSDTPTIPTVLVHRPLPETRSAVTHKFNIAGHEGYITVGLYPDGAPGEIFVTMAKEGATIEGLVDTVARLTSISLQHGVPLDTLVRGLVGRCFEPSGLTDNQEIRSTKSVVDYVFRWLGSQFIK